MKRKLVGIISGPTASGKTKASLELCRQFPQVEIVNFDSLLFYRELNIGTAKPSEEELLACPHHLVNVASAKDPLNAADYVRLALKTIERLHHEEKTPLLVGGSGFYLQALLYGMFDSANVDAATRERSNRLYAEEGIEPFLAELRTGDPASFERYHENDHYRIRRAVEHLWTTGTRFSEQRETMLAARESNSNARRLGWSVFHGHLDLPKPAHWEIIQERASAMLENGLVEEVESLLQQGFTGKEKPLQSIGYKETLAFINGELAREELCERISVSTRKLAKAQRTW